MIPTHVLNNLNPDDRVAVLSRGGELRFLVHRASDDPTAIRAAAAREGAEVLSTHMGDKAAILEFVRARERDIGGEA